MEKPNCAKDHRICWPLEDLQNLDLWFDSREVFVVEYDGFATINKMAS